MAQHYLDWLDNEGWTDAALARKLTELGRTTSRAATNAWRRGTARPGVDRLAKLNEISNGAITARSFEGTSND
jgi:hypothetical protein